MFLLINTSNNEKIFVGFVRDGRIVSKSIFQAKYKQTEKLLPMIEKLLEKNKIHLKDLKGIIVVRGPGSFTSLRVGVVTANTLAFALNKPVVGVRGGEFENLEGLIKRGIKKLKKTKSKKIVVPFY